jgi:hypothetical protein
MRAFFFPMILAIVAGLSMPTMAAKEIEINYSTLVCRYEQTHSAGTVGEVLDKLRSSNEAWYKGDSALHSMPGISVFENDAEITLSGLPQIIQNPKFNKFVDSYNDLRAKRRAYLREIEPFLEHFAFLLEDAVAETDSTQRSRHMVDCSAFFPEGNRQPAWVDLVRTKHFVVFSDGVGYVRIFLPGIDATTAWEQNYPAVRHIVNAIRKGQRGKTPLTIDCYAFENDLAQEKLRLRLPVKTFTIDSVLPPPSGRIPLDLGALQAFLDKGITLEGGALDPGTGLVLIGSRRAAPMTLDGQKVALSDLAVAFRAVFYSGYGVPYQSLDHAIFPELVNSNFGGRLHDTRLGASALKSDIRFKTISSGLDPYMGNDLYADIHKNLAFEPITELISNFKEGKMLRFEQTRFWFYPDTPSMSVRLDPDGRRFLIQESRFTADAERMQSNLSSSSQRISPWTAQGIGDFNRRYQAYAGRFPELADLDNAGRLLLLFSWLKIYEEKTGVFPDLDALLSMDLPAYSTPREKTQFLTANVSIQHQDKPPVYHCRYDCSWLGTQRLRQSGTDEHSVGSVREALRAAISWLLNGPQSPLDSAKNTRKSWVKTLNSIDSYSPEEVIVHWQYLDSILLRNDLRSTISDLYKDTLEKIQTILGAGNYPINEGQSINGGVDLGFKKVLETTKKFTPDDMPLFRAVMASSPVNGCRPPSSGNRWFRSGPATGARGNRLEEEAAAPSFTRILTKKEDRPSGAVSRLFNLGETGIVVSVIEKNKTVQSRRWGPSDHYAGGLSRAVYHDAGGRTMARREDDIRRVYCLRRQGDAMTVARTTVSPGISRAMVHDAATRVLRTGNAAMADRILTEGIPVSGFSKTGSDEFEVMSNESGTQVLRTFKKDAAGTITEKKFANENALPEYHRRIVTQLSRAGNEKTTFVYAYRDNRRIVIAAGDHTASIDLSTYYTLTHSMRKEPMPDLDKLFSGNATGKVFALYIPPCLPGGSAQEDLSMNSSGLMDALMERYGQQGDRFVLCHDMDLAAQTISRVPSIPSSEKIAVMDLRDPKEVCCTVSRDIKAGSSISAGGVTIKSIGSMPVGEVRADLIVVIADDVERLYRDLETRLSTGKLDGKSLVICGNSGNFDTQGMHTLMRGHHVPLIMFRRMQVDAPGMVESFLNSLVTASSGAIKQGQPITLIDFLKYDDYEGEKISVSRRLMQKRSNMGTLILL